MNKEKLLQRIEIDQQVMTGKPVIRGTRLTVQHFLGLLAQGITIDDILNEYRHLTQEDIFACLLFATKALDSITFVL